MTDRSVIIGRSHDIHKRTEITLCFEGNYPMATDREQKKADRRAQILHAAAGGFAEKGYSNSTVDEIASAAGIAKGSVYNYFSSKQELFTELFTETLKQDEDRADQLIAREDITASEKLSRQMDDWRERFGEFQKIGRLVLEFWMSAAGQEEGPFVDTFNQIYMQWRQRLTGIFEQGGNEGEFQLQHGPEMAATVMMAIFDGISLQAMLGVGKPLDEDYLSVLKKVILNSVASGKEGSG